MKSWLNEIKPSSRNVTVAFLIGGVLGYLLGGAPNKNRSLTIANSNFGNDNNQKQQVRSIEAFRSSHNGTAGQTDATGKPQPVSTLIAFTASTNNRSTGLMLTPFHLRTLEQSDVTRREHYEPLFRRLNLNEEQIAEFLSQLRLLHEGAIYSGESTLALMNQRMAYDKNIRKALGEEGYREYRKSEASKPYERDAERFSEYAKGQNIEINPEERKVVANIFEEIGVHQSESWENPYDPMPRPALGNKMVAANVEEEIADTQRALQKLPESGAGKVSDEVLSAIKKSFNDRIAQLQDTLTRVNWTPEQAEADRQRRREESDREIAARRAQVLKERGNVPPP